ncbi:hypothetical protein AB4238_13550 [Shewanella sp. 10N.286.45.A1]|uniref:hypothetical protein n=1 Tax=Shewanella sp. 10N.286.45.A1 TaxID=3229694 RepID=UPI003553DEB3
MSVIEATRQQFHKSNFAQEVVKRLVVSPQYHDLFYSWSTTIESFSNVLAAIVAVEAPDLLDVRPVTEHVLLKALFAAYCPLFIKQIQGNEELTHSQQILMSITLRVANDLEDKVSDPQAIKDIKLIKKFAAQSQALTVAALREMRSMS